MVYLHVPSKHEEIKYLTQCSASALEKYSIYQHLWSPKSPSLEKDILTPLALKWHCVKSVDNKPIKNVHGLLLTNVPLHCIKFRDD